MFKRLIFTLLVLLLLISSSVYALTLAKASLEELTSESELIVHGKILSIESDWEDNTHSSINTYVLMMVDEYIKGYGNSQILIKQFGGTMGDLSQVIPGSPQFTEGEEVILFLQRHGEFYEIHSIALGCFRIFIDDKSNTIQVVNDLGNAYLIDPLTKKEVKPEDRLTSFELNSFISEVRSFLK